MGFRRGNCTEEKEEEKEEASLLLSPSPLPPTCFRFSSSFAAILRGPPPSSSSVSSLGTLANMEGQKEEDGGEWIFFAPSLFLRLVLAHWAEEGDEAKAAGGRAKEGRRLLFLPAWHPPFFLLSYPVPTPSY